MLPVTLHTVTDTGTHTGIPLHWFYYGIDDNYSNLINLGFGFHFFGHTYYHCVLSTNGYLSFDSSLVSQYSPWPITAGVPSAQLPKNAIFGCYQDLSPGSAPYGLITYGSHGQAPNRIFILSFCSIPYFHCGQSNYSGQIVLHESTNQIDIYTTQKDSCSAWNQGAAIEGIQNSAGTQGYVVAGRNYPTVWTAALDGFRFTPDSAFHYQVDSIPYQFYDVYSVDLQYWRNLASGQIEGTASYLMVSPDSTTQYQLVTGTCPALLDTITVHVIPSNLLRPLISPAGPNYRCMGDSLQLISSYSSGNHWSTGDTTQSITVSQAGYYTVSINDSTCGTVTSLPDYFYLLNWPLASFTYTANGSTVTFNNFSSGANSYDWDFGDGASAMGGQPVHTYLDTATQHLVILTACNYNCCDTFSMIVHTIPVPFGLMDPSVLAGLAVNASFSSLQITLAPSATPAEIYIYDITGRQTCLLKANAPVTTADISRWAAGMYFYVIHFASGVETGKFIKP